MTRAVAITSLRIALLAIAAVALYRYCLIPYRCSHVIPLVERRTRAALERGSSLTAAAEARENLRMLDAVSAGCQTDVDYHLLLAFNEKILGHPDRAIEHLTDSLRVEDRPELYMDRGLIMLDSGRLEPAVKELAVAVKFNPDLIYRLDGELRTRVKQQIDSEAAKQ